MVEAEDLLRHFAKHWEACAGEERPEVARKQLLAKIIDKVFVYDQTVVGISLHEEYGLILDTADLTLSEWVAAAQAQKASLGCQTRGKQGKAKARAGTEPPGGWATPFVWAHQFESYQPILHELLPV
ncbi:MAG: hypothetical protein IPL78_21795 [Chloroflexi bacterium]|nr:hypothetical protein [Chloroflexota bacterium]